MPNDIIIIRGLKNEKADKKRENNETNFIKIKTSYDFFGNWSQKWFSAILLHQIVQKFVAFRQFRSFSGDRRFARGWSWSIAFLTLLRFRSCFIFLRRSGIAARGFGLFFAWSFDLIRHIAFGAEPIFWNTFQFRTFLMIRRQTFDTISPSRIFYS